MELTKSDIGKKVWLKADKLEDLPRELVKILDVDNGCVFYEEIENAGMGECPFDVVECYAGLPATPAFALFMLSQTKMRNFDQGDWMAWSGCNSETPMIGEMKFDGEEITVILDGDTIGFYNEECDWSEFKLTEICER